MLQAREATLDFDADDEALLKKDGAALERSAALTAATSLDMAAMFQMEEQVLLLL